MREAGGGVPVGAVLASAGRVLAQGRNERVQRGDPVAHGEIACLRNAGRRPSYRETILYITLSPCPLCSGAILLFQIPQVIVGEAESFAGDLGFLTERGALPRGLERGHRRPVAAQPRVTAVPSSPSGGEPSSSSAAWNLRSEKPGPHSFLARSRSAMISSLPQV
jgi:tRNA(Arg) A34 adenosine deaminase TadA